MALRRAAVKSQAPGRSGIPSRGQCSSAASRASCTRSSASSKLPSRRTSAPVSRPASSRKTRAIAACVAAPPSRPRSPLPSLNNRPDLYELVLGRRPRLGDGNRGVKVGDLEDPIPADRLLSLDERTVGHDGPAAAPPHGGGCAAGPQLIAPDKPT